MGARAEAPERARERGWAGLILAAGVGAAGGLGRDGCCWPAALPSLRCLHVLALLAVAGVFLIFGLLSGFLRLERAGCRGRAGQDASPTASTAPCRSSTRRARSSTAIARLQRLTGRRAGPARHARGAARRRAGIGAGVLPPQPGGRARPKPATRCSTSAPTRMAGAAGAGCRCRCVRIRQPRDGAEARLTHLAGGRRHPRARCARSRPWAGWRRRSPSTTACRRACWR